MLALLDSGSEINNIYLTFAWELELPIRQRDIGAQKINNTILNIFEIIVVAFSVTNMANQVRFFEEIFLVANVSPKVIFGMSFLTLSSANVDFLGRAV